MRNILDTILELLLVIGLIIISPILMLALILYIEIIERQNEKINKLNENT